MTSDAAQLETGLTIAGAARATGMPIRRIRLYAELVRAGDGNEDERLALLEEHRAAVRAELEQVQTHLAFVERKIAIYKERNDA